ncbi:MAG: nuclear transport factor 2 family protein [Spirosomaceae bacterium]|jgi:ketosteroid isomerase-like protein|nr:nuclear transport factor 2 family protein [Spirosomataceae bacterium]
MKKVLQISTFLLISTLSFAQVSKDRADVLKVLARQNENWNKGNIDAFMEDYLKSDSLMFIGAGGITYGWQATKDRYFKSYPDRATMGQLKFDILKTDFHSPKACWVLGKWHLTRPEKGDIGGVFTLILKKVNGKWLIVSDHTSQVKN